MSKCNGSKSLVVLAGLTFASTSLSQEGQEYRVDQENLGDYHHFTDDANVERSRWVCVANIKRGSVYGYGATMEEAQASVLRRCFPNSLCLAHMTCRER
ncbi:MAG: hypothetical protein FJ146_14435 [Deltaproteobacteria bacterium]|nr:hypothetical protein [Deltaproteobacteria bacterium]